MKILDIAHRGASDSFPENTASAFKEAIRVKADVIELDVQLTKDKQVVVLHDTTINRTSNGKGKVTSYTLDELRKFDFGMGNQHETILTLQEALKLIGKKCITLVELKTTLKGHEQLVVDLVKRKNIWLQSDLWSIVQNINSLNKTIPLGYIAVFSIFHRFLLPSYKKKAALYNVSFFTVDELLINKLVIQKFIQELKQLQKKVYVWTINDLKTMHQAINWGADGIITNKPGTLMSVLKGA